MSLAYPRDVYARRPSLLWVGAWFGLVTGLVEGIGFLVFQKLGWLNWVMSRVPVHIQIVWISALFDLLLFGLLGLAIAVAGRLFPRLPTLRVAVFAFALLACFDWLALAGRIRHSGVFFLSLGLGMAFSRWFHWHSTAALRFWERTLPGVAAVAVFAFVGIQGGLSLKERLALARLPAAPLGSPNILIIVVDTLRADHLSAYGYNRPTSPNLERIAQQGVLFENAFATSSWTLPSHVSMLTGRYPHEHGAEKTHYDGRYRTLPEELRDRGYRTAAFSANRTWFIEPRGFGEGFIRFDDFFHSVADMAQRTLYGRKFVQFVMQPLGYEVDPGRKRAAEVNREILGWVGRDAGRPFFAFLNYFDVHDPYVPPEPYRHRFSKLKRPGGILNSWIGRYYPKMTPEQLQSEIDAYDGGIAYVDEYIGRLLLELNERELTENTLVVITSDHGESFGEHGLLTHLNALYREVIHVPLIFHWPGHLPAGLRVPQPVSIAALPATLMELAGAPKQNVFPGPSLARLWKMPGDHPDWPYPLAELAQFPFEPVKRNPSYHGAMKSLVSSEWHYIQHEKFGPALYNWPKDPGELQDLAQTPEGRPATDKFAVHLRGLLASSDSSTKEAHGAPNEH